MLKTTTPTLPDSLQVQRIEIPGITALESVALFMADGVHVADWLVYCGIPFEKNHSAPVYTEIYCTFPWDPCSGVAEGLSQERARLYFLLTMS